MFSQNALQRKKAYVAAPELKKEKMKLVVVKWRFITENIWTSSLSLRKWWEQVFKCLDVLYKDIIAGNYLSIHKELLAKDIVKYSLTGEESGDDLDLMIENDDEMSEIEVKPGIDMAIIPSSNFKGDSQVTEESSDATEVSSDDSIL
ncbi:hypothetical protein L873DRAFT_1787143 [Choiromyces venosus 120613-1]|uniref:Uncharacterized protein n=1 Tax=Choiromyces venosus 120613-1 TaxID=1336337 RepID=A0A3N4K2C9_9PEZI|nr:hypothetical protein L873DRAFT_1787143 [Choiromyces venosus 120613-1]